MHADPRPRAAVTADHRHVYLALWLRDQPPQPSGGAMAYHRAITAGEDRPELPGSRKHDGLSPKVDTMVHAMQSATFAANGDRILVDAGGS